MPREIPTTCPLCDQPAWYLQVDLRRKHFKCATCTEFVIWREVEARITARAESTRRSFSDAARATTDPDHIYVISGRLTESPPPIDLEGSCQLRIMALAEPPNTHIGWRSTAKSQDI